MRTALRPALDRRALPPKPTRPARPPCPPTEPVVVNIAYGTEKKKWLEAALEEYLKTPAGQGVRINLLGMGSVEGANAVLDGPKPAEPPHQPIHVWSPASSAYRDVLETEWRVKHGAKPDPRRREPRTHADGLRDVEAALRGVREAFRGGQLPTLGQAMKEPEGWGKIAGQPEWGLFKFGHTDPNKSNSGLQALVLMAYEFAGQAARADASRTSPSNASRTGCGRSSAASPGTAALSPTAPALSWRRWCSEALRSTTAWWSTRTSPSTT